MMISNNNDIWFVSSEQLSDDRYLNVYDHDNNGVEQITEVNDVHKIVGNWKHVFIAD